MVRPITGAHDADKDPTKPEWQHHGEQKKGLKFYATAGAPTGEAGFACWETVGFPGPDQVVVTISNDLTISNNIPRSGGEPQDSDGPPPDNLARNDSLAATPISRFSTPADHV